MSEDLAEVKSIHSKETVDNKIQIIRDDIAETKRMVRKLYFESFPELSDKLDTISDKVDKKFGEIEDKLNQLLSK